MTSDMTLAMVPGHGSVTAAPDAEETVRVASVNWGNGGIDDDGGDTRWRQIVDVLGQVRPQVVLCQELGVPQEPMQRLTRHLRRTANALGMEPVLGPVTLTARSALHLAILIDTRATGWRIDSHGPYPGWRGLGGTSPAWCTVELHIGGLARPLHCYSVHLPARDAVAQLSEAHYLATLVAEQPQLALVGGDFNSLARGGPPITSDALGALPGHLRVTRCRADADGRLEANVDVDDVFTYCAGLCDIAAHLPETRRDPPRLHATAPGGARIDRFYGSPELAAAATFYRHLDIGSDHDGLLLDLDLATLTRACEETPEPTKRYPGPRSSAPADDSAEPPEGPGFPGFPPAC